MNRKNIALVLIIGLLSIIVVLQIINLFKQNPEEIDPIPAGHTLIGTWELYQDAGDSPALISFSSDGTSQRVDGTGTVGLGAWTATGPNSATSTIQFQDMRGESSSRGWGLVRAEITVMDDAMAFNSEYTLEFSAAGGGASSGEIGPGSAEGQRITSESVGISAAPLSILEASPVATPM